MLKQHRVRFPEEMLPHENARKLLERLGVEIVAGDQQLIKECRESRQRQFAYEAAERERLRGELERHRLERSRQAAAERTEHMPYRRAAGD